MNKKRKPKPPPKRETRPIPVLNAEHNPTTKKHILTLRLLGDGYEVDLGKPHGARLVIEREKKLTRVFLAPDFEGDEAATVEFRDDDEAGEAKIVIMTAGGKVLFDSTVDNRYALPDS